jgi:cell wall-associated NlpC family hydrolase
LQQAIETLNTSIVNLIQSIANASFNKPQNTQGSAGSQQTTGNGGGFPGMTAAAFSVMHGLFGGIGGGNVSASSSMGGGNAGNPNVSPSQPSSSSNAGFVQTAVKAGGIAAAVGAIADFGQAQMPGQIALNQNAVSTFSMMPAGSTFSQAQDLAAANSVGTRGSPLIGPVNLADAAQGNANLQFLAGSANYNATPLGRAGFSGASSAMIASGGSMNEAQATAQAAGLYSRGLSFAMMQMGRGMQAPLNASTGLPQGNPAQIAHSLSLMINKPSTPGFDAKTGTLSPTAFNKAFGANTIGVADLQNLNAMSGNSLGNVNDYIQQMREYNSLMHGMGKGAPALNANQATSLMNQAVRDDGQGRKARATLEKYNIQPTDIQKMKQNQAQLNARGGDESKGFTQGLDTATNSLIKFNAALNQILSSTGAATGLGYAGGMAGTYAGTSHGALSGALGLGGSLGKDYAMTKIAKTIFGKGGTAATGAAEDAGAGIAGDATGLGVLGGAAMAAAPLAAAAAIPFALSKLHHHDSSKSWLSQGPGSAKGAWNNWDQLGDNFKNWGKDALSIFGGAANPASVKPEWDTPPSPIMTKKMPGMMVNTGGGMATGGKPPPKADTKVAKKPTPRAAQTISGQSRKAVSAAEKEIGVPYLWGGETPGVGFDCSGLVQWAYKQAGVSLPRTSEQQWSALSRRAVSPEDAQAGDLVFMAGSGDGGSANSPGHVGMMISRSQVIQAPYTGAKVQVIGYNPHQWSHVARPAGSMAGTRGPSSVKTGKGSGSSGVNPGGPASGVTSPLPALGGLGSGAMGNFTSEADAVSSALGSLGGAGAGLGVGGLVSGPGGSPGGSGGSGINPGGPSGKPGAVTKSLSGNKKIMNTQAAKYGWGTGSMWSALNSLEMGEAGYRNTAWNNAPGTSAYGMGQFEPATWATVGGHKTSDPTLQSMYMLRYIKKDYGNPERAYSKWLSREPHWYSEGTNAAKPGLAWVGERGPELVKMKGGESVMPNAQSMATMKAAQVKPAQSPWSVPTEMSNTGLGTNSPNNQPQSCVTNVNIGSGAINVNMPPGTGGDITQAGQAIAKSMMRYLGNENLHATITRGHKL